MANITWANQELIRVQDVKDFLTTPNVALRASADVSKSAELEQLIKTKIRLSKIEIFNELMLRFKKRIPETINNWLAYKRYLLDNQRQTIERDLRQISVLANLPIGASIASGALFDLLFFLFSNGVSLHPTFYSVYGTPVSGVVGTNAGAAVLGDFLIDSQHWFIYINTSQNVLSPTWTKFFATSALDNILNIGYDDNNNPGIFMTVARAKVIELMCTDGSFVDRVGYDNNPYWIKMAQTWKEEYEKLFDKYFPLLRINLDQSGVESDYDLALMTPNYDNFYIL